MIILSGYDSLTVTITTPKFKVNLPSLFCLFEQICFESFLIWRPMMPTISLGNGVKQFLKICASLMIDEMSLNGLEN